MPYPLRHLSASCCTWRKPLGRWHHPVPYWLRFIAKSWTSNWPEFFMFLPHLSRSSVTDLIEVGKSSNGYMKFWWLWLWSVPGMAMESYLQPPHAIRLLSPPTPHLSHLTEQRNMWVMRSHRFHEIVEVTMFTCYLDSNRRNKTWKCTW